VGEPAGLPNRVAVHRQIGHPFAFMAGRRPRFRWLAKWHCGHWKRFEIEFYCRVDVVVSDRIAALLLRNVESAFECLCNGAGLLFCSRERVAYEKRPRCFVATWMLRAGDFQQIFLVELAAKELLALKRPRTDPNTGDTWTA
jgi:hypothetical protein